MSETGKDFEHVKIRIKFKTKVNIVWGQPLKNDKREALAYPDGFPATFYMTDRRCFVVGHFMEKGGAFRKKSLNSIYFEVGTQYVKKYELDIYKAIRSGYISFDDHGMMKAPIIHFIRLTPDMCKNITQVIEDAKKMKRMREDTGIVIIGGDPEETFKKRLLE